MWVDCRKSLGGVATLVAWAIATAGCGTHSSSNGAGGTNGNTGGAGNSAGGAGAVGGGSTSIDGGASGVDAGLTCVTSGTAGPLPMDASGWVPASSNAYCVQGQWSWGTDNSTGGLSTFTNLVANAAPYVAGSGMCISGTSPGGASDGYKTWGGNIYLTLNQSAPDSTPAALNPAPPCFTITVNGSAPGGLVAELCPTLTNGWGVVCPQINLMNGANEVCVDNVARPSYCDTSTGLTCYTTDQLKAGIQTIIVQGAAGDQGGAIDFCVTSIIPHEHTASDAGNDDGGTNYVIPSGLTDYGTSDLPTITPGQYDARAFGHADVSKIIFPALSAVPTNKQDPQVLDLSPDLVPRAWLRKDTWGLKASDYDFTYPPACQAKGTLFMAGTTASMFYPDEVNSADFLDQVTRNAAGKPVPHPEVATNCYRATLANPAYRQRLVNIGKIQIDGGVDGVHFDEVLGGYTGANWAGGNEGFDNYHVADFGAYLCTKYAKSLTTLTTTLDVKASDNLDCTGPSGGRNFDYRGYIARHDALSSPLSSLNPLAADWGTNINNRPDPSKGTFLETYPALVYWQQIVVALRTYARQTYNREILISANGIFPFVDLQSLGLYTPNADGPGNTSFDWVPVTGSDLNGTVSFKTQLEMMKAHANSIAQSTGAQAVPMLLFLDYATPSLNRYYALPLQARKDYFRLYAAEAYALGIWFAVPLATTSDTNTATALGMMDFFKQLRDYYKGHAALYKDAQEQSGAPTVSASNVTTVLTKLPDESTVVHVINHNYSAGVVNQQGVTVSFPMAATPTSVMLASPDFGSDRTASFTYSGGTVTVTVGELDAYVAVVAK